MNRRQFLNQGVGMITGAAGVLAAGAIPTTAFAGGFSTPTKVKDDLLVTDAAVLKQLATVATDAAACASAGDACVQHCSEMLAMGMTDFAHCNFAAQQMRTICHAMEAIASMKSVRAKELVVSCIAACKACKDACAPHATHHAVCHACMQACTTCQASCEELQRRFGA